MLLGKGQYISKTFFLETPLISFFGQWSFKNNCFWDLLTFSQITYYRHYIILLITNRSWILTIHMERFHTSHQYLENLHWFEAIFKKFGRVVFEAIEVKGRSMSNFEVTTLKICNNFLIRFIFFPKLRIFE